MSSPTHPSPPGRDPDISRPGGASRRERRAFAWGLGISVGFHVVLLLLYPFMMDRLPSQVERPPEVEREVERPAMEVVTLREFADDPQEQEPEEPEPDEVVDPAPDLDVTPDQIAPPPPPVVAEPPVDPPDPPAVDPDPEPDPEDRRSVAERLRPQGLDPRLWAPLEQEYMDLTDAERAQLLLHGMIRNWNDSMAVAAALSDAARDWTYTDEEGRRWGLSPGRLHLGDFSIPLPFSFEDPPGPRNDWGRDRWIQDDITRGAAAGVMRDTWAERARAIRERMDADRDRRRGGGGSGGGGG